MTEAPFWKARSLAELDPDQWDALCDRCGQCCLHKLEDIDTGALALTDVACKLLDLESCTCTNYARRREKVPDCVQITPDNAATLPWLPETCAYRLLARGQDLAWWHPLVSGSPETVHEAGISVRGKAVSETDIEDLEDHVTGWLKRKGGMTAQK